MEKRMGHGGRYALVEKARDYVVLREDLNR
jgi:hypothetical protein